MYEICVWWGCKYISGGRVALWSPNKWGCFHHSNALINWNLTTVECWDYNECWGSTEIKSGLSARFNPCHIVYCNHSEQPIIQCGDPNPDLNSISYALRIKANSTQRANIFPQFSRNFNMKLLRCHYAVSSPLHVLWWLTWLLSVKTVSFLKLESWTLYFKVALPLRSNARRVAVSSYLTLYPCSAAPEVKSPIKTAS